MPQPIAGKLAAAINELVDDLVRDIERDDRNSIDDYLDMVTTSPIIGPAIEVFTLLLAEYWGDYTNTEETHQAFIRQNFEQMRGSLLLSVSELVSVKPFGYATSERSVWDKPDGWMLDDIQILHPSHYVFEGTRSEGVTGVKYRSASGSDIPIPRDRLVHVVNQRHLAFRRPTGVADCKRAIAAWKAWKIVVNEMLVAGQRQAVPIIVGYTQPGEVPLYSADGRTPLRDADNNPVTIPATKAMLDQLENIDNRAIVSTDIGNRIEALAQQTDGRFFFEALKILQQMQLLGLLIPGSILTVTGVGDSELNKGQQKTLNSTLRSTKNQIVEEILERVVRPLLLWNYGVQATKDLGNFAEPKIESEDQVALLNAITNAVENPTGGGFLPADLDTINRGRELAGIPSIETLPQRMKANTEAALSNSRGRIRGRQTRSPKQLTRADDDDEVDDEELIEDWQSSVPDEYAGVIEAKDSNATTEGIALLWLFSKSRARYLRPSKAVKRQMLTQAELETLINDRIQVSRDRLGEINDRYYAEDITLAAWYAESLAEIRLLHSEMLAVGSGGIEQMSEGDRAALKGILEFQESELTAFRDKLALSPSGEPSEEATLPTEAQSKAWLNLYALSGWTAFKTGERSAAKGRGMKYGRRYIDPTPHASCADCEEYADRGWVDISDLIMPGEACQCYGNCRCTVEYSDSKEDN